jgi:hypothetical protein
VPVIYATTPADAVGIREKGKLIGTTGRSHRLQKNGDPVSFIGRRVAIGWHSNMPFWISKPTDT